MADDGSGKHFWSEKLSITDLPFSTRYAIHPTLITTYGLINNSYAGNIQAVVTMDDLFAEA